MATLIVYDTTPTGAREVRSNSTVYATARAGASLITETADWIGQDFGTPLHYCFECYYQFDTSALGADATVSAVSLELDGLTDNSTTDSTFEARAYDWGGTVTTADWVAGDSLAALTLLATWATSGFSAGYNAFTSDAAFPAAINRTGFTRFLIASDRLRLATTPTGPEKVSFVGPANPANPPNVPKLTVTYTSTWPAPIGVRQRHFASATPTFDVYIPDGSNAVGTLIVAFATKFGTGAMTWPAGWVTAGGGTDGASSWSEWGYRIVDGTEGFDGVDDSIFITGAAVEWAASCISFPPAGWHGITPPEGGTPATGASTAPDPPTLSPSWGSGKTLWLAYFGAADGDEVISGYPAGFDAMQHGDGTVGAAGVSHGFAMRYDEVATTDPSAFAMTTGTWRAFTVAVQPPVPTVTISPDADTTTTGWTATPLWSKVDEDPATPDGTIITATSS